MEYAALKYSIITISLLTGCAANPPCTTSEVSYWGVCEPYTPTSQPYYKGDVSDQVFIEKQSEWLKRIK